MFIELTRDNGEPLLINKDQIVDVTMKGTKGYIGYRTTVSTRKGLWDVQESYDEVKEMLSHDYLVHVDTATGEIDQLYEDADNGISYDPLMRAKGLILDELHDAYDRQLPHTKKDSGCICGLKRAMTIIDKLIEEYMYEEINKEIL